MRKKDKKKGNNMSITVEGKTEKEDLKTSIFSNVQKAFSFEGVLVSEINVACYLGKKKKNAHWGSNEIIVYEAIEKININSLINKGLIKNCDVECPIGDLVYIYLGLDFDSEKNGKVTRKDLEVIKKVVRGVKADKRIKDVYVNLYLDDFLPDGGNSVDLTLDLFIALATNKKVKYKYNDRRDAYEIERG